ncbi:uncharacterized protein LOC100198144 [Hydra vulgaris]|uniref:Purple acid phosphatase n=1 Tax=Hydra vulgaris TaxID=6087 RepID=A0ABM4BK97_HYDVU
MGLFTFFAFISIFSITYCKLYGKDPNVIQTYFRKTDENNRYIDRSSPDYENALAKPFINKILQSDAGASLKVSPSVIENGGSVTIEWLRVNNSTEKDFVAFYCPSDDISTHYLDYFNVNNSPTWSEGFGKWTVTVYNMRTSCIFKYYRNGNVSQLVTISNELSFQGGPLSPLQGHLALTSNPTEMRVMWVSAEVNGIVMVRYGTTKALEKTSYKSSMQTYSASDMCEPPANSSVFIDPGYIYDVLLYDLHPNTKYYYSYGTEGHMSAIMNFTTAIPAGDSTSYKAIFYGDMGVDPYPEAVTTAKLVYDEVLNDDIRFIYHNGDISYARGYAYIWEQWFKLVEPYSTLVPYMVGIGNHEYDHVTGGEKDPSGAPGDGGFRPDWFNGHSDSGGECSVPMFKRFHMPDTGHSIWWYSYDYGLVHYIMLSSEHDYSPDSKQYIWLENDLKNVDRKKTPWVVVGAHRAMYCSALIPDDYIVALNMQRLFEDLLYIYKVDLALWAHYHSYERTCKVYKNKCQDDGVTHLVIGSAGKSTDPDVWFSKEWSVYHINDYGYGKLTVVNSTAMYWEWIQNKSKKVMDSFWLTK